MRLYMSFRQTEPPVIAAAKAGFSPASAYRIEQDPRLPSQKQAPRERRRRDPLSAVCDSEVVPPLKSVAGLRPVASSTRSVGGIPRSVPASAARCNVTSARGGPSTAPSRTSSSVRSTRRAAGVVRFYRHGDQGVSIAGAPLDHRLYHFRLAFSGWEHAQIVLGGESFVALAEGLQNALWALGRAPLQHRSDSLSAAFRNLADDMRQDQTRRYEALCAHYSIEPTRNNAAWRTRTVRSKARTAISSR